jgi:hypothetical protein
MARRSALTLLIPYALPLVVCQGHRWQSRLAAVSFCWKVRDRLFLRFGYRHRASPGFHRERGIAENTDVV